VAAHLDPDILMVDEVLSVGDAVFQRKCLRKMQSVGEVGRTVLFVSHDMTAISRLAPVSLVIDQGVITFMGPTHEAIRIYASQSQSQGDDLAARTDRIGDGIVRMDSVRILDANHEPVGSVGSGDPVTIAIGYRTDLRNLQAEDLMLDMRFRDVMGHPIVTFSTRFSHLQADGPMGRHGVLFCHIPALALAEETYSIDLWLAYRRACADSVGRVAELQVTAANYFGTGYAPVKRKHGAALIRHVWTADPEGQGIAAARPALAEAPALKAECSA
jgi:lipopolysaccharide transport system ATP-binding protein